DLTPIIENKGAPVADAGRAPGRHGYWITCGSRASVLRCSEYAPQCNREANAAGPAPRALPPRPRGHGPHGNGGMGRHWGERRADMRFAHDAQDQLRSKMAGRSLDWRILHGPVMTEASSGLCADEAPRTATKKREAPTATWRRPRNALPNGCAAAPSLPALARRPARAPKRRHPYARKKPRARRRRSRR